MRSSKPEKIGDIVESVLKRFGLLKAYRQQQALESWAETAGEIIANVAKAERIEHGRLYVKVEDSSWRNEIHYYKRELIDRLNEKAGEKIVKDIILV